MGMVKDFSIGRILGSVHAANVGLPQPITGTAMGHAHAEP